MVREWIRTPLTLALGLGLCLGLAASARAQHVYRPGDPNCPCPPGQLPPGYGPNWRPLDPSRPFEPARPGDQRPADPSRPRDPMAPSDTSPSDPNRTQPDAQASQNQNQQQTQDAANDFSQAPSADASGAGGPMSSGANTPIAGRLDMTNRFNLFDNMAAFPQSRVWFGYQLASGQNTGVSLTDTARLALRPGAFVTDFGLVNESLGQTIARTEGLTGDITRKGKQHGYRFGAEIELGRYASIGAQGTYFQPFSTEDPVEDFGNPQFVLKHVLLMDDFFLISGTFGITPEIHHDKAVLNDNTTHLYPGLISYFQITENFFVQAASQVALPTEGSLSTLDWGVSLGYWLYRDETRRHCLQGIIPQVEVFGRHMLHDGPVRGQFHLNPNPPTNGSGQPLFIEDPLLGTIPFNDAIFVYNEPQDVVDMTCATQFVLRGGITVTTGISFPLSSERVRDVEFLSSINYFF